VGSVYTLRKSAKYSAKWSSSNKSVATVSSSGKITAKKKGSCNITAVINGKKSTCKLTVMTGYSKVTITPKTTPYNNKYMNTNTYNDKTRVMYTIRSYMSKFENEGGGTLVLSKGEYPMVNGAFIPSNVTIELADGATIYKSWDTGTKNMKYKVSIFSVIPPSIVTATEAEAAAYKEIAKAEYKAKHPKAKADAIEDAGEKAVENSGYQFPSAATKYNGSKNVVIKGAKGGNSVIDHKGKFYTFGIATGHANGLTVQDINFKNMDGNHFIELNSSKNVLIQRCTFTDDLTTYDYNAETGLYYYNNVIASGKSSPTIANKEAINIDTCDPNIKGFNNPWAYHDYTACDNVTVQNCTFTRIVRPIGSHKYTATQNSKTKKWDQQVYCTNIKILNNKFVDTGCNAITMCNWNKVTVTGNTIETVSNTIENPYKNHTNTNFFRSINPSKSVNGKKVVETNSALKQKVPIVIFGGGADITIKNNKIDNAVVGVAAFNINNLNGGEKYAQSAYRLSAASINNIKNNNTYTNISSGCSFFFARDSVFGAKSVSAKREYLSSEYNLNWTNILQQYYEKYKSQFKVTNTAAKITTAAMTTIEEAVTENTTESVQESNTETGNENLSTDQEGTIEETTTESENTEVTK
jgi:hypothetical protein